MPPENQQPTPQPQPQPTVQTPPPVQPNQIPTAPAPGQPASKKHDGFAIAAFVTALIGVFFLVVPVVAVILGIIGLKRTSKNQTSGKGLAWAGIGIAAFSILVQAALLFFLVISAVQSQSRATTEKANMANTDSTTSSSTTDPITKSQADAKLRQDLIKAIALKESVAGRTGELTIVSVDVQPKQGTTYAENWTVEDSGVTTVYKIKLIPTSGGGTDYTIE